MFSLWSTYLSSGRLDRQIGTYQTRELANNALVELCGDNELLYGNYAILEGDGYEEYMCEEHMAFHTPNRAEYDCPQCKKNGWLED